MYMEKEMKIKVLSLFTASILIFSAVCLLLALMTNTPSLALSILIVASVCFVLGTISASWNMLVVFEKTP